MKRYFINPICALSISFESRDLSLAAILEDAILYRILDNEIGLQYKFCPKHLVEFCGKAINAWGFIVLHSF